MASRILLFVLISAAQTAAAQTLPLAATKNAQQPDRSKHAEITLELRSVALSDRGIEWLRAHKGLSLPAMSCHATLNQQQIDLLIDLAKGDRDSIDPELTLGLPNGGLRKLAMFDTEHADAIQATLLQNPQSIELRLLCATDTNGKERFPPITAPRPAGIASADPHKDPFRAATRSRLRLVSDSVLRLARQTRAQNGCDWRIFAAVLAPHATDRVLPQAQQGKRHSCNSVPVICRLRCHTIDRGADQIAMNPVLTRIVFHADDSGLSPAVTEGVLRGFRHGLLTSSSLLSNAPDAAGALVMWKRLEAERQAGELPSLAKRRRLGDPDRAFDLGVHLNLTQGRPLTANRYPSELLDAHGRFPGVSALLPVYSVAATASARPCKGNSKSRCSSSATTA